MNLTLSQYLSKLINIQTDSETNSCDGKVKNRWVHIDNQTSYRQNPSFWTNKKLEKMLSNMDQELKNFQGAAVQQTEYNQLEKLQELVDKKVEIYQIKHSGFLGKIYQLFSTYIYGDINTIRNKLKATIQQLEYKYKQNQIEEQDETLGATQGKNVLVLDGALDTLQKISIPSTQQDSFVQILDELQQDYERIYRGKLSNDEPVGIAILIAKQMGSNPKEWQDFFNTIRQSSEEKSKLENQIKKEVLEKLQLLSHPEVNMIYKTNTVEPIINTYPGLLYKAYLLAKREDKLKDFFTNAFRTTDPCLEGKSAILGSWYELQVFQNLEAITFEFNPKKQDYYQIFGAAIPVLKEIKLREAFENSPVYRILKQPGRGLAGNAVTLFSYASDDWTTIKDSLADKEFYSKYFTKDAFVKFLKEKLPLPLQDSKENTITSENLSDLIDNFITITGMDPFAVEEETSVEESL